MQFFSNKSFFSIALTSILFFCLVLSSCSQTAFYEKNIDLPKANWYADSVLTYSFEITDIQRNYKLYYNLRNNLDYPFYNLYITYYLQDANGKTITTELQNITLMDSKTGKPFGNGLGDIFSHRLLIPNFANYKFPKKGKYIFKIKQYMRRNPLPGVLTFGLRVE